MAPKFASITGGIWKSKISKAWSNIAWTLCLLVLSETFRCSSPPPSSLVFIRCNVQMEILCHMFKFQKDLFPSLKSPACGGIGEMALRMLIFFWQIAVSFLSFSSPLIRERVYSKITQIQNRNTEIFFHSNETNQLLICTALEGQLSWHDTSISDWRYKPECRSCQNSVVYLARAHFEKQPCKISGLWRDCSF